jgi:glycosyltransferase involved in cell wall biosynthesis
MFSIIIPLYNKAHHIEKTLGSVLKQTCPDFEVIVVNDGSTDNGPDKVRGFKDQRVRIIDQVNAGVSSARNNGAHLAKNDYIAFLDADDWWEPAYLAEMKQFIEAYPDAGIYAAKYAEVKHGRKKVADIGVSEGFRSGYINYFDAYARTMWMPLFPSSAIMPLSEFLAHGGFRPGIKLGEDFELWVRVALKKNVAFLNRVLVYYNQDVDVSARGINPRRFRSCGTHFVYHLAQFKKEEQENPDLKILLDKLRAQALLKYYLYGINFAETSQVLREIDWNNIPQPLKRMYEFPKPLVRAHWKFMKTGSAIKQWILRTYLAQRRKKLEGCQD